MMYLWLLVILGHMATVANSWPGCACPCEVENKIKESAEKHKAYFRPNTVPSIPGLSNLKWGLDVSVIVKLDTASTPWKTSIVVKLLLHSTEIPDISLEVSADVDVVLGSPAGVLYINKPNAAKVSCKILNTGIILPLDPITQALTGHLKPHFDLVVGFVFDHINQGWSAAKGYIHKAGHLYIGIEAVLGTVAAEVINLKYKLKDLQTGNYLTYEDSCPAVALPPGGKHSICCSDGLITSLIGLLNWEIKFPVHKALLKDFFKGVPIESLYVHVYLKSPPKFVSITTGCHTAINLHVHLYSSNTEPIATAEVTLKLTSKVHIKGWQIGLELGNLLDAVDVSVISTDPSCGCDNDIFKPIFVDICNLHLWDALLNMNCQMENLVPFPVPTGHLNPAPPITYKQHDSYFICSY